MNKIGQLIKLFAIYKARTRAFPTIHLTEYMRETRLFFGEHKRGFYINLFYFDKKRK